MEDRAGFYRERAEECRAQAAKTYSENNRAAWLKLAADWLELADGAYAVLNRVPTPPDRTEVIIEFDPTRKRAGDQRQA